MDKTAYNTVPKDVTHGRGYVYLLQYHIVFVTKYRDFARSYTFTC